MQFKQSCHHLQIYFFYFQWRSTKEFRRPRFNRSCTFSSGPPPPVLAQNISTRRHSHMLKLITMFHRVLCLDHYFCFCFYWILLMGSMTLISTYIQMILSSTYAWNQVKSFSYLHYKHLFNMTSILLLPFKIRLKTLFLVWFFLQSPSVLHEANRTTLS